MKFRSKNEEDFYNILREVMPRCIVKHDYNLGGGLKLDFYIESPCKIGFEVDGAQHYSFNSRFHETNDDFLEQTKRDRRKELICRNRGISLVRLDARKKLDKDSVKKAIDEAIVNAADIKQPVTPMRKKETNWEKAAKQRQREYRAEKYRQMKAKRKR